MGRPTTNVTVNPDPRRLEDEFLKHVAALRRSHPIGPHLILAPTQRLLDRLAQRMAQQFGALAGFHLHHHHSLSVALGEEQGSTFLREIPQPWLAIAFLQRLDPRRSSFDRFLRDHPRSLPSLFATFRDLRDSGLEHGPEPASLRSLSPGGRRTMALFVEYQHLWQTLESRGFADTAIRARRARKHVQRSSSFVSFQHYGAYDLIGVHLDLVKSLLAKFASHLWIPGDPGTQDQSLATTFLHELGVPPPRFDETDFVPPLIPWTSLPDPRWEVRFALRLALRWVKEGIPLHDIVLLSRNPTSHGEALARECDRLQLPLSSSWKVLERGSTAHLRARHLLTSMASPGRLPQTLSDLQRQAESQNLETLSSLAAAMTDSLPQLDDLWTDPPSDEWLPWMEQALDAAQAPVREDSDPGLTVLDLQQARGLSFEHGIWLGLNEGLFPRQPREDSFLPDRDRLRLREITGCPVPLKGSSRREEELLLRLTRHSVRHLQGTLAREDGRGRVLSPSPWLRNFGDPSQVDFVPSHPLAATRELRERTGLLRFPEVLTLHGLEQDVDGLRRRAQGNAEALPFLAEGIRMVRETERWTAKTLPYDGHFGSFAGSFSATSLTDLSRCPLQFAMRHRLGLRPEEVVDEGMELTARETGILVHEVLHRFYDGSLPESDAEQTRVDAIRRRLNQLFHEELDQVLATRRVPLAWRNVRGEMWVETLTRFVLEDLNRWRKHHLRVKLLEEKHRVTVQWGDPVPVTARFDRILIDDAEEEWVQDYKTKPVARLKDQARLQDCLRGRDLQLAVYWKIRQTQGRRVGRLEYVSILPERRRDRPVSEEDPFVSLEVKKVEEHAADIDRVFHTLQQIAKRGQYPMLSGSSPRANGEEACGYCDFRRACRHSHFASVARVESEEPFRPYYELRRGPEASS